MHIYLTLKWIHVLAAGLVLGLLAVYPFLPSKLAHTAQERAVVQHALRVLRISSHWLLVPSIIILFLTGLPMSAGPIAEHEMLGENGQWIIVGMFLWTLVAAIVAGLMLGIVKEMTTLAERGETASKRMLRLWRQFRWGYLAGTLVTILTIADMVYKPTFF